VTAWSTFRFKVRNGKRVNFDGVNSKELSSPSGFDRYDAHLGEINRAYGLYADKDCLYVSAEGNHPSNARRVAEIAVKGKKCCYRDRKVKETFLYW